MLFHRLLLWSYGDMPGHPRLTCQVFRAPAVIAANITSLATRPHEEKLKKAFLSGESF